MLGLYECCFFLHYFEPRPMTNFIWDFIMLITCMYDITVPMFVKSWKKKTFFFFSLLKKFRNFTVFIVCYQAVIESIRWKFSCLMTKPTKWPVCPAKTQISLGICPVWSESSLCAWRNLVSLATHWAHSESWSDWMNAQAVLSLRCAYRSFCWFCHEAAQLFTITLQTTKRKV